MCSYCGVKLLAEMRLVCNKSPASPPSELPTTAPRYEAALVDRDVCSQWAGRRHATARVCGRRQSSGHVRHSPRTLCTVSLVNPIHVLPCGVTQFTNRVHIGQVATRRLAPRAGPRTGIDRRSTGILADVRRTRPSRHAFAPLFATHCVVRLQITGRPTAHNGRSTPTESQT